MCNPDSSAYGILNPTGKLLGDKYQIADPLMYNMEQNMRAPNIPAPPPPPQSGKTPDAPRRTAKNRTGTGTMLTGPSGVASGALVTGGNTMLGG